MSAYIQPMSTLSKRATLVLIDALGVADTIRYLNQFKAGHGNYTERKNLFADMAVEDVIADIKSLR